MTEADLGFHRHVWHCARNDTLFRLLELVTVPLLAFAAMLRSHGLQKLTAFVAAHSPLLEALRGKNPAQIRKAFYKGATSSYESFLGGCGTADIAQPFGFLESFTGRQSNLQGAPYYDKVEKETALCLAKPQPGMGHAERVQSARLLAPSSPPGAVKAGRKY